MCCMGYIGAEIGKMRQADCGSTGYIPLENMGQDVLSDGSQDGFAMGMVLDSIFLEERVGKNIFYVSIHGNPLGGASLPV